MRMGERGGKSGIRIISEIGMKTNNNILLKQKRAYEFAYCLVGSEMSIRDSPNFLCGRFRHGNDS